MFDYHLFIYILILISFRKFGPLIFLFFLWVFFFFVDSGRSTAVGKRWKFILCVVKSYVLWNGHLLLKAMYVFYSFTSYVLSLNFLTLKAFLLFFFSLSFALLFCYNWKGRHDLVKFAKIVPKSGLYARSPSHWTVCLGLVEYWVIFLRKKSLLFT